MIEELKQRVLELVEPSLATEGYEVADIVLSRYKNKVTLKLFVYSSNPVTIDECARLSRLVGDLIDGTDLFDAGYTLEISSPGLDRPLTTFRDFKYRVGETVKLLFVDRQRKQVTAEIVSAADDAVEFRNDDGSFTIPLSEIERAKILY
ncbi:MAG: ribosome maturation factor RimP [Candidatus Zixiibacteriota bacterium]|jgi:ribosome maturation factor RimP